VDLRLDDAPADLAPDIDDYRAELTRFCYRMLGSVFEADDAVQEAMMRAWRAHDRFEGRSSLRSWLYRITTNVCIDHLNGRQRRARPMDLQGAAAWDGPLSFRPAESWIEPFPDAQPPNAAAAADPGEVVAERDSVRLALIAALQHLPPRQRAALILCEVLEWKAADVAELLGSSVASVNSALQRARATMGALDLTDEGAPAVDSLGQQALLDRYLDAFERYDIAALTALIHEDATQSMPPIEQWLASRDDIMAFWQGPGAECEGSRMLPAGRVNGRTAFAQYRKDPNGGYFAWSLQVLGVRGDRIGEFSMFLDTERLFPRFGLPLRLDADGAPV
jgi:RNA polymerase sigma-70 factor (ECF subfamily)